VPEADGDPPAEGEFGFGVGKVLDVNRSALDDGSASHPAALDRIRESNKPIVHRAVKGGHPELIPFDEQKKGVRRLAEPAGALD
jgi:hypothetical protein